MTFDEWFGSDTMNPTCRIELKEEFRHAWEAGVAAERAVWLKVLLCAGLDLDIAEELAASLRSATPCPESVPTNTCN